MKKFISVCLILLVSAAAFAQQHGQRGNKEDWREKVRAEKVAFLTQELSLTEAEAQAFWPVYNDVQEKTREAFKVQWEAFKKLSDALESGEGSVDALLNDYLAAKAACEKVESDALPRYKQVLPVEKVAKLILAEEKFRHQQIGRLGGQGGRPQGEPKGGFQGERPQRRGNR
jgi:hypothetical protein